MARAEVRNLGAGGSMTMIAIIKAKGFNCSVKEAVFSNSRETYVQVLSLVGLREAVKAVWARLMKGETAYLELG